MPNLDRIRNNLRILIALNEYCYGYNANNIVTVFTKLVKPDNHDNGLGPFGDLFFAALSDIADLADFENPVPAIITALLAGLINSYNTTKPFHLLQTFGQIYERNTATSQQISQDLAAIADDVEHHLTDTFTIPPGVIPHPFDSQTTIQVSDLDKYPFDPVNSAEFLTYGTALITGFRNALTKQQLPSLGGYSIGGVTIRYEHAYNTYIAQAPPTASGGVWSADAGFTITNNELQLQDRSVTVIGSSMADWNKTAGDFCAQSCALLVVTDKSETSISYQKYYMLLGFYDGERDGGWYFGANDFYNWLFQDDGFGRIINSEGVGTRNDIFRTWGIQYGGQLPHSKN